MNKLKAQQWMSQALDGELSARRRQRLEQWLAAHPEDRVLWDQWQQIGSQLRAAVEAVPPLRSSAQAWAGIRAELDDQKAAAGAWTWFGGRSAAWAGSLAALLIIATGVWWWSFYTPTPVSTAVAEVDRTQVEWIDTDIESAMPVVYTDAGTGLTVIWVSFDEEKREDNGYAG